MLSFHNDPKLKEMLLTEIENHRKADLINQGAYQVEIDGVKKYCAVGCSINSLNIKLKKSYYVGDHSVYETELGIPKEIAYLEDNIFENLPIEQAMLWPERFIEAIPIGVDLSKVIAKLMIWQFEDEKEGLSSMQEVKDDKEAYGFCEEVVALYKRVLKGETVTEDEFYNLYLKIDGAGAGAGAWAWAWAWAGARAGAEEQKFFSILADKLISLLEETENKKK